MQHYHSSRRSLIKGLITGGLLSQLPILEAIAKEENANALVLSCIDFRFIHIITHFLKTEGLEGKYDWTALAGASLSLANFPHPAETEAFWDQLDISYKLHHVRQVIICDHQDCGAYQMLYPNLSQSLQQEKEIHSSCLKNATQKIQNRYPDLKVQSYFANLTGIVEVMS
ncbi:Carbonic anhydrase [Synechococcus sp. PCC 7502]|uniref:carbonic anhydrase n=1 Tax=Synechococcus sp. PCC 7502 TaxID=1173263 RepID=UPI00029FE969|nr:carbonic anhydrase [Synechococcus sp. PCC 7502]AFY73766.1 Carbonic anhydrase [Synechococcus sp. PCC 7502]